MAYGRIIQVTIIPPGQSQGLSQASAQTSPTSHAQIIKDLHMSFKVKKAVGIGAQGPTAELKIYNMSLASYFNFVKINYGLAIAVGYQDETNGASQNFQGAQQITGIPLTLFSGSIRFCRRYRESADIIIYIEADGMMWNVGSAPYSVSYQAGIDVYSMFQNLSSKMNVSILNMAAVQANNATYDSGFSFIGNVRDFVAQLCTHIGFNFVIDGGEIILIGGSNPLGAPTRGGNIGVGSSSTQRGMVISRDTGLLQPPQPEQTSVGVPGEMSEAQGGSQTLPEMRWKIDALLLPQVGPGDIMLVKSENFASGQVYMMAVDIEYTGDNRKDDWKMEARCIPVDSSGQPTTVETSPLQQGAPVL